ncbi:anhydro-N-acetylmuramic acid kinase [Brachybacterium sp. UNK5269]|uniref:anhydro-N-acetylmuramic acid kinase n=1 Tax=Brachybacterium sp. UNK5269 TaxID=3408576 RepID=UPI003BAE48E8
MMSGTSLDAIDVALVDFSREPDRPATLCGRVLHIGERPWPGATREALRAALPPAGSDVGTWNRLHAAVGEAFAGVAAEVLGRHGGADLIATHGQTLHHDVRPDGTVAGTLQIGDAARIARAAGIPVLHDLRAADVAAGGQGAPLVPLLDQLLLGGYDAQRTAVLNIGGISNGTLVGPAEVIAGDLGPGNALLDAAVHAATGRPADLDAALARTGTVDPDALAILLADPFYTRPLPRSTGREHFDGDYVRRMLGPAAAALSLPDLLATLVELTAVTIAHEMTRLRPTRVVASGGGMHNPLLRSRLAAHLDPVPLLPADALGIPGDGKEALLIALLGYLGAHGLPGTLRRGDGTAHTGAREPVVLGSLTPPHALRLLSTTAADHGPVDRLLLLPSAPTSGPFFPTAP